MFKFNMKKPKGDTVEVSRKTLDELLVSVRNFYKSSVEIYSVSRASLDIIKNQKNTMDEMKNKIEKQKMEIKILKGKFG